MKLKQKLKQMIFGIPVLAFLMICLDISLSKLSFATEDDLAYFKQFLFQKEVDHSDPDFPRIQYRYLMAVYPQNFTSSEGNTVFVNSSLYLYENGTYDLYYREMLAWGPPNPDGTQPLLPNGCKHFKGQWSVPEADLVVGDRGLGKRHFEDNQHQVAMTFLSDIISAGLKGQSMSFSYGYSNISPDQQFCF